jgi:CHAD domain-containing protein
LATARCREFVITDGAGEAPQRIAAALEPRFRVIQESRRRARQVWLDTFDWRLHAAGLVLRQVNGPGPGELVLTTAGGEAVLSQPLPANPVTPNPATPNGSRPGSRRARWPGPLSAIPDGALRDRLDPVVEVRALLPLARTEGTMTRLRVLDDEMKTVARITVEDASLAQPPPGAARPLPPRLTITPVRGYASAAQRTAHLLSAADGFEPGAPTAFVTVLATAGREPGDYNSRIDVKLAPAMPAGQALAAVLLRLADTIEANVGFALRDVDTEFLHDLRVAVRRTRSALKLAGDVLPAGLADRFAPEFKWLGDLTTPTRDLDVYLAGFGQMTARLSAAAPGDLEPFRAHLTTRRAAERRKLARGLRSARFSTLMAGWRAALEEAAKPPRQPGRGRRARSQEPDIATLAAERIARAYRRVAKRGAAITAAEQGDGQARTSGEAGGGARLAPAGQMHTLRKRGKELRYLLEFFGSLYEPAALRRAVKDLKGLQECLGDFQDAHVQREAIWGFAVQMAAQPRRGRAPAAAGLAATLLALGELTAVLHAQQDRARAEVAGYFAEFARAGGLRTLGILPRTAGPCGAAKA